MKISRIVWVGILTTFSAYLFLGLVLNYLAISESFVDAREEVKQVLMSVVSHQITEPIKLGSYLEAKNRLQGFIDNGIFECAELEIGGVPLMKCENRSVGSSEFSTTISLSSAVEKNPKLSIFVNSQHLNKLASKKQTKFFIILFFQGLFFLGIVLFFMKKIGLEILSLSLELDKPSSKKSFISEINDLRMSIRNYLELKNRSNALEMREKIGKQVAHDIRSPLSVLNMTLHILSELPEEKKMLIQNSIKRINDIADDLLSSSKVPNVSLASSKAMDRPAKEKLLLVPMLIDMIDEKKMQYSDKKDITFNLDVAESSDVSVFANAKDLMRVFSNILNNSVESFKDEAGKITVFVSKRPNSVEILFEDDGCGIPDEIIRLLGMPGITFGKKNGKSGHGIGLSHAQELIFDLGGKMEISSKLNLGTAIKIELKIVC